MGINNRQRRAAKLRRRGGARSAAKHRLGRSDGTLPPGLAGGQPTARPSGDQPTARPSSDQPPDDEPRARPPHHDRAQIEQFLHRVLLAIEAVPASSWRFAEQLIGPDAVFDRELVSDVVATLLTNLTKEVVADGWTPADLGQLARRRLAVRHAPVLAGLLVAETDRHPPERVSARWRAELAEMGPIAGVDTGTTGGMEIAVGLAAVLGVLPMIARVVPPPGAAVGLNGSSAGDHQQQLGKVRALLAKAESTEFAEEAEALSAKAQEMISRYALEHLLDEPDDVRTDGNDQVQARRIWIDAPYVLPKALLIDAVAQANRCSAVVAEKLGFSTVIGAAFDLEAVDLLSTSLLVQANRAMLGHGSQVGWGGTSRTTSFRRSFLVAYATRIGERLSTATADATNDTGRAGELVPVLRQHAERVAAAQAELFPRIASRTANAHDVHGWTLGRAAADQARLEFRPAVAERDG